MYSAVSYRTRYRIFNLCSLNGLHTGPIGIYCYYIILLYIQVQEALKGLPSADMFVLEMQAPRSPTLGFLGISIELRIIEAFVHALARTALSTPVQSIDARMVAHYFGIRAKNRQAKKKAAVELVSQILSDTDHLTPMGNKTHVPDDLKVYFLKEKKKDDLSDSLLQAIAVFEWGQMAQDL